MSKITIEIEVSEGALDYYSSVAKVYGTTVETIMEARLESFLEKEGTTNE